MKVALHLRWLSTEKFQNNEAVKGGCIPSKNKLRWLASDINFKLHIAAHCYTLGVLSNSNVTQSNLSHTKFFLSQACRNEIHLGGGAGTRGEQSERMWGPRACPRENSLMTTPFRLLKYALFVDNQPL